MSHALKSLPPFLAETRRAARVFDLNTIRPEQLTGAPATADLLAFLHAGAKPDASTEQEPAGDDLPQNPLMGFPDRIDRAQDPEEVSKHLSELLAHLESLAFREIPVRRSWRYAALPPLCVALAFAGGLGALDALGRVMQSPILLKSAPWLSLLGAVPLGLLAASWVLGRLRLGGGPFTSGDRLQVAGRKATVLEVRPLGLLLSVDGQGERFFDYALAAYYPLKRCDASGCSKQPYRVD